MTYDVHWSAKKSFGLVAVDAQNKIEAKKEAKRMLKKDGVRKFIITEVK